MNRKLIKNKLSNAFIEEAAVPGVTITNKTQKETGKSNKEYYKDVKNKMKDYDSASKSEDTDAIEEPKTNIEGETETYHDEMEIMNGQEMIQYGSEPSEQFKDRAEKAIVGHATMGNDPTYANVVPKQQGFTGPDFGKNLVNSIKSSKKKRDDQTPQFNSLGDDIENKKNKTPNRKVAVESTNKKNIMENNKTKVLKFNKPFDGLGNALQLIENVVADKFKVDKKEFVMTDGNETYRFKWEGSLTEGKAVVLKAKDANMVNEDVNKMKHLMGFKSETTLGTPKGAQRLAENSTFADIMNKTKTLMTEAEDREEKKSLNENHATASGSMGFVKEVSDPERAEAIMAKSTVVMNALEKLNTPMEEIEFAVKFIKMIAPNEMVQKKIARILVSNAGGVEPTPEEGGENIDELYEKKDLTNEEVVEEELDRFDEVFAGADDVVGESEDITEGECCDKCGKSDCECEGIEEGIQEMD